MYVFIFTLIISFAGASASFLEIIPSHKEHTTQDKEIYVGRRYILKDGSRV